MKRIKKNIKKVTALSTAILLINSNQTEADIYRMNTKEYISHYKISGTINNLNQDLNHKAAKEAIEELKQDIYNIEYFNFFVINNKLDGIDGVYYHNSNNIYITVDRDLDYMNELNQEDKKIYKAIEIRDRKSTIYHEVGHLLTINHLTDEDLEEYKKLNNNYNFNDQDWSTDIYENIAEDFNSYFFYKYNGIEINKNTINQEIKRDQKEINKWIESIIDRHNTKIKEIENNFNNLIK